ncbi:hypothetical protein HanRHA438_Chr03g0119741 [Helianthus annuus]|nr:hypothetical protein HanRHA438_Chr03g0119741 [Helianthus annuus]
MCYIIHDSGGVDRIIHRLKENVEVQKNQLMEMLNEIEEDHERLKVEAKRY